MADGGGMSSAQAVIMQVCQLCNSNDDVRWYCENCDEIICGKCKEIHLKGRKTRNDNIISLAEARRSGKSKRISITLCKEHKTRECEFHCKTCNEIICPQCLTAKHQKHEFTIIEEFVATKTAELQITEQDLNTKLTMYEQAINTEGNAHIAYQAHVDKLRLEVEGQYSLILDMYVKCRDNHLSTLKMLNDEELRRYAAACTNLQRPLGKIRSMIENIQKAKEIGNVVQMMELSQEVQETMKSLETPTSPAIDYVSFYRGKLTDAQASQHFGNFNATPTQPQEENSKELAALQTSESETGKGDQSNQNSKAGLVNDIGLSFIKRCIAVVEERGLKEPGLYSAAGVLSKAENLITLGLDPNTKDKLMIGDAQEYEIKTITAAIKTYLRNLPEPLMTFKLHDPLVTAAKQDTEATRIRDIHKLVHQLPERNFKMLDVLISHLTRVAEHSAKNLMTKSNLSLSFGPTLIRPENESQDTFMYIRHYNYVVELLINYYGKIFKNKPENAVPAPTLPTKINRMTQKEGYSTHLQKRVARTLYCCEAENPQELSFKANQIITNVRPSKEPGWVEGTLDGKIGLIPENYIEYIGMDKT